MRRKPHPAWAHLLSATDFRGESMRRDELMKSDLLSDVVLLGSGLLIILVVMWTLVAAITGTAALP